MLHKYAVGVALHGETQTLPLETHEIAQSKTADDVVPCTHTESRARIMIQMALLENPLACRSRGMAESRDLPI